jgi:hypothetical protein
VKSRAVVLVTVNGPAGSEDVVLAADVVTFQLMPALTALVGGLSERAWSASASARWHLSLGDRMLSPTRTLSASGVMDGHVLQLSAAGRAQQGVAE